MHSFLSMPSYQWLLIRDYTNDVIFQVGGKRGQHDEEEQQLMTSAKIARSLHLNEVNAVTFHSISSPPIPLFCSVFSWLHPRVPVVLFHSELFVFQNLNIYLKLKNLCKVVYKKGK